MKEQATAQLRGSVSLAEVERMLISRRQFPSGVDANRCHDGCGALLFDFMDCFSCFFDGKSLQTAPTGKQPVHPISGDQVCNSRPLSAN
jgi:hypothetical protein